MSSLPPVEPVLPEPAPAARGWWIAIVLVAVVALGGTLAEWLSVEGRQFALTRILTGPHADWLPWLVWLALLPCFWRLRFPAGVRRAAVVPSPSATRERRKNIASTVLVGAAAGLMSHFVGGAFVDEAGRPLPPAYHDEYSYSMQAETFAAGRTWFPSFAERPELFDQMHVLNEGRMASRYFPGVGAWLLPGYWLGDWWLPQRFAHLLAAVLVLWCGRELCDNRAGLVAGLLYAVSPGLVIFSNLLLAHQPTLVGLLVFQWMFLRWLRTRSGWDALLAGCGLSFAMLCRPMTAAAIGLPFGVWFAWGLLMGRSNGDSTVIRSRRWVTAVALGLPLVAGLCGLAVYNRSITGSATVSPYQLYTDLHTPRHVYGFNNVVRGEQRLGPRVVAHYDAWAENLTPELAARNVGRRVAWSLRWTLGIVPLVVAGLVWLLARDWNRGEVLGALSIVSLHVAHVPYWFEGIMGWHYVLESAPGWLLLFGCVTSRRLAVWERAGMWGVRVWWGLGIGLAIAINCVSVPLANDGASTWWLWESRLEGAIREVRFPRVRYAQAREEVDRLRGKNEAVVLVLGDPADRSMDYVVNDVPLTGDVLWVRVPPDERNAAELDRIADLFPGREALVLDAARGRLSKLRGETDQE
jgi:hypothetical protein